MINTGLKDKVVIVTGANHGIGAGIALAFAKEGAKVFINYYRAAAEAYGQISDEEAKKAIEMFNESELEGRKIIVNEARPMAPRAGGEGGGYDQ